ncbi:hypothetical protein L6164_027800 [Bauhinia variegata]|uniref:Uncharacterized protein n=1 Tax=Bauhinia variegata TaxID=167791 RepID=A0ACB9LU18_BAUVA|nr:hypothetical protein L6164_027800 [Bauhinia variegata]
MESNQEETEKVMYPERESEENLGTTLEVEIAELAKTKEELSRAKESVMQSWLDSKPLIDELERQKSNLASTKTRASTFDTVISELESQLETIEKCIELKRKEELNAQMMVNELYLTLDETRSYMERLKQHMQKERQARSKLRQIQQLRRQTLKALQLTLQATLIETDALEESAAKALRQISHSETQTATATVQLTHEDHHALTRRARRKFSQADHRISVIAEQKLEAESIRDLALSRLNKLYSSRSWRMNERNKLEQRHIEQVVEEQDSSVRREVAANTGNAFPKGHAELSASYEEGKPQQYRRSGSNVERTKKKASILHQTQRCLGRKMKKLFG